MKNAWIRLGNQLWQELHEGNRDQRKPYPCPVGCEVPIMMASTNRRTELAHTQHSRSYTSWSKRHRPSAQSPQRPTKQL